MKTLIVSLIMTSSLLASAQVCKTWAPSKVVGTLDHNIIDEASGIALSHGVANRLYHINDSGSKGSVFVTDASGANTKEIKLSWFAMDTEDLAYGKCGQAYCLYVGDIGDNYKIRPFVQIAIVQESKNISSSSVRPLVVKARYPDGAHNAEGMALHPNGDMYIITKEKNNDDVATPAKVYKIPASKLYNGFTESVMDYVGEINLPKLLGGIKNITEKGKIVTSFDISPDGKRFVLLTYQLAVEVNIDLSKNSLKSVNSWKYGVDYSIAITTKLPQQEAISYFRLGRALLYNSEMGSKGDIDRVNLFATSCSSL